MTSGAALVLAPRFPEFDRESGSRRVFDLITMLADAGWSVTVGAEHANGAERYGRLLAERGVEVHSPLGSGVETLVAARRFDLAIVAFWFLAERYLPALRELSPSTRVIVDSIDLHFLRNARGRLGGADGGAVEPLGREFGDQTARELTVYAAADAVLAVSKKEADLISDLTAIPGLARVVPDCEEIDGSHVGLDERRGVLFVGNFHHPPNVEAVEFLCREIVTRLDPAILSEHPVRIVGNALDKAVERIGDVGPNVELIGWVPSVLPYVTSARVCVTPVLHGAGTKRKLIQSLMAGTPAVSTGLGKEGLEATDGEHLLVADDADAFAAAVERLLRDDVLWQRLAVQGRDRVRASHGRAAIRQRFLSVIDGVLTTEPRPRAAELSARLEGRSYLEYERLVAHVRDVVAAAVPKGATVLTASKGDRALVELNGYRGWHFPQTANGTYAGEYPADARAAIDHVDELRERGAEYLLFPRTAFWWLDHYSGLQTYLEQTYKRVWQDEACQVYRLEPDPGVEPEPVEEPPQPTTVIDPALIDRVRPAVAEQCAMNGSVPAPEGSVLVLGVYLANQPNSAEDIVSVVSGTRSWQVTQRWIGLCGEHPSDVVRAVTVRVAEAMIPKYKLLNDLLAAERLETYEFVVALDDDIVLPHGFLDCFLAFQRELRFAMAQPARTASSYIDHPITEQQRGVVARRTLFVEIGPLIVVHKSAYDLVFPFDLTSPMGWGYENVWAHTFERTGLRLGIIDAVPVAHNLRKPTANYGWQTADRQGRSYLREHEHLPMEACMRVLEVISAEAR